MEDGRYDFSAAPFHEKASVVLARVLGRRPRQHLHATLVSRRRNEVCNTPSKCEHSLQTTPRSISEGEVRRMIGRTTVSSGETGILIDEMDKKLPKIKANTRNFRFFDRIT